MTYDFWDLRDDRIAECRSPISVIPAVQPCGNPINHSNQRGLIGLPSSEGSTFIGPCSSRLPMYDLRRHQRRFFHIDALRVGHNPDAIARLGKANVGRRYAIPFRIVPDRGQVSEYSAKPSIKQCCDVLHEDEVGSKLASKSVDFAPEPRARAFNPCTFPGVADILAREATGNDIDAVDSVVSQSNCREGSDIIILPCLRKMLAEKPAAKLVDLAEGDSFEAASALQAKAKAAYATK